MAEQAVGMDEGLSMATLVLNSRNWIHRLVDSLRLEGTRSRLHKSFDVTIPRRLAGEDATPDTAPQVVVPLGFYSKGVIRVLDMRGPDGNSLPILTTEQNAQYVSAMLLVLIPDDVLDDPDEFDAAVGLIDEVVRCDGHDEALQERLGLELARLRQRCERPETARQDWDVFEQISTALIRNFILLVVIDGKYVGERCVLKLGMDVELAIPKDGPRGVSVIRVPVGDFSMAASRHCEIRLPDDLIVSSLAFVDPSPAMSSGVFSSEPDIPRGETSIGHIHTRPSEERFRDMDFVAVVTTPDRGILSFTRVALVSMVLLAVVSIIARIFDRTVVPDGLGTPSPAVSMLLVGATLLLSWRAFGREHELVVVLFSWLRRILQLCLIALAGVGVLLAVDLATIFWWIGWAVVYGLIAIAVVLYFKHGRRIRFEPEGSHDGTLSR